MGPEAMWEYRGQKRPPFAEAPGPGQESVWDYPRPPRLVADARRVEVRAGGATIARSARAVRVLETASPPTFYLPPEDVDRTLLVPAPGRSVCEWKGAARYWALAHAPEEGAVAWSYPDPVPAFAALRDHLAFYPGRVECYVAGERVRPQAGRFYGGWITRELAGPFKGEPGTERW
ncbi:MAG: DUF427 domain-containing protein [Burkholderiales bacterium]|nr:DUF427 domain-containing protein [Burkholderiales bacterium]